MAKAQAELQFNARKKQYVNSKVNGDKEEAGGDNAMVLRSPAGAQHSNRLLPSDDEDDYQDDVQNASPPKRGRTLEKNYPASPHMPSKLSLHQDLKNSCSLSKSEGDKVISQMKLYSQAPLEIPRRKYPTFLDLNPVLKTLTTMNLGYELVNGWMGRYKLHTDVKNWFDAQEVCAQEGANLLVINSRKEAKAMRSLVEKTGTSGKYHWVGFHDMYEEGNYVTIFNESVNSTGYADWGRGEPDGRPGEHFGVFGNFSITTKEYGLGYFLCSVDLPYICEEETVAKPKTIPTPQEQNVTLEGYEFIPTPQQNVTLEGNEFILTPQEQNVTLEGYEFIPSLGQYKLHRYLAGWQEAVDVCAQERAHLLIINSEKERVAVTSLMSVISYIWTGVHDQYQEGNYVTIFNDTLQSTGDTKWWPGQPGGGRDQNCVAFVHYSSRHHGLNDWPCTDTVNFMCEFEV